MPKKCDLRPNVENGGNGEETGKTGKMGRNGGKGTEVLDTELPYTPCINGGKGGGGGEWGNWGKLHGRDGTAKSAKVLCDVPAVVLEVWGWFDVFISSCRPGACSGAGLWRQQGWHTVVMALRVVHGLVVALCWMQGKPMVVAAIAPVLQRAEKVQTYHGQIGEMQDSLLSIPIILPTSPTNLAHINPNIPSIPGGTRGRLVLGRSMTCDPRFVVTLGDSDKRILDPKHSDAAEISHCLHKVTGG